MANSKYIQRIVIKRFSERHQDDEAAQRYVLAASQKSSEHLKRFLRMAEARKRQIMERMLMDGPK